MRFMMNIRYFEDLDKKLAYNIAEYVTDISSTKENGVARVSMETILECDLAIVALVNNKFAGYIRAKEDILKNVRQLPYRQVGSLVVAPEFQGSGVASRLVREITDCVTAERSIPFALVNSASEQAFLAGGYEHALPGDLPQEASSPLNGRPVVYSMSKFINLER